MRSILPALIGAMVLAACSPRLNLRADISNAEKKFQDHTGFILYDPESKKTVFEYNSEKYFTPASNTKIFTFYSALKILGDSIPALSFHIANDSLILWGTGDPSFLNRNVFDNGKVYNFLKDNPRKIYFSSSNFNTDALGPGWAWDDYSFTYSAERSPFPVFGNTGEIGFANNHFTFAPRLFQNHFVVGDTLAGAPRLLREIDSNQITYFPATASPFVKPLEFPFHYSADLLVELLSDTLKTHIEEIDFPKPANLREINSIPADSLYSIMMQESDNFIAEQLLLMCARKLSDTLNPEIAIRYAKKYLMADLPDELVWVDGSGLSRYNLFTPRTIAGVWEKILMLVPRERLFNLLAVGGQKGTIKNLYRNSPPFIFGKTGSLSNNHSLSGYLITKKGKLFIFSFMNSNFVTSGREIRSMMENILTKIRDNY